MNSHLLTLPTELETVTLRQLRPEDAPVMFDAIQASRDHLSQFGDITAGKYPDLLAVEQSITNPQNPDKLRMGIWDGEDFVGSINLTPDEEGAELGYWLDARRTGHGYATLATRALAGHAAERYKRVHAEVVDDNGASRKVLERARFIQTAKEDDKLVFEFSKPSPVRSIPGFGLYIHRAQEVEPGAYALLEGTTEPIQTRQGQIYVVTEGRGLSDMLPGVHVKGMYNSAGFAEGGEGEKQIISFLYHKRGADGQLETKERAIVLRGIGYGVHPDHAGQDPSWYLIGPQLGLIDPETGQTQDFPESDIEIPAKHFSLACITGGPLGEPVLANPA